MSSPLSLSVTPAKNASSRARVSRIVSAAANSAASSSSRCGDGRRIAPQQPPRRGEGGARLGGEPARRVERHLLHLVEAGDGVDDAEAQRLARPEAIAQQHEFASP